MEMYFKGGKLWAKGEGTPKQVMDFLNEAVATEREYEMVDGEYSFEREE